MFHQSCRRLAEEICPIAHDRSTPDLISIVAPAYNEEDGLEEFVRHLDAVMISSALSYEIVFVNDGSTDRTLQVMQELRAAN